MHSRSPGQGHKIQQVLPTLDFGMFLFGRARMVFRDKWTALRAGFSSESYALGTITTGTTTLSIKNRNFQDFTNGGSFTLAPWTDGYGTVVLDQVNNGSAGTITRSGWTKTSGDSLTTTNGHKFRHFCSVGPQGSHIHTQALQ